MRVSQMRPAAAQKQTQKEKRKKMNVSEKRLASAQVRSSKKRPAGATKKRKETQKQKQMSFSKRRPAASQIRVSMKRRAATATASSQGPKACLRETLENDRGVVDMLEMHLSEEGDVIADPEKLLCSSKIPSTLRGCALNHSSALLYPGQLPLIDHRKGLSGSLGISQQDLRKSMRLVFLEKNGRLQAMIFPMTIGMLCMRDSDNGNEEDVAWDLDRADAEHQWQDVGTILQGRNCNYRYNVKRLTCVSSVCMGTDLDLLIVVRGECPTDLYEAMDE